MFYFFDDFLFIIIIVIIHYGDSDLCMYYVCMYMLYTHTHTKIIKNKANNIAYYNKNMIFALQ